MFALTNDRRESPHKLPVSIFKERLGTSRGEPPIMRQIPPLSTPSKDFFAGVFQLATYAVAGVTAEGRAV